MGQVSNPGWSVAPRAGAWIETQYTPNQKCGCGSPPVRGRGLKHHTPNHISQGTLVAPRAGAWIETINCCNNYVFYDVAPRAGAWIETSRSVSGNMQPSVAPRAGAWIETKLVMLSIPQLRI